MQLRVMIDCPREPLAASNTRANRVPPSSALLGGNAHLCAYLGRHASFVHPSSTYGYIAERKIVTEMLWDRPGSFSSCLHLHPSESRLQQALPADGDLSSPTVTYPSWHLDLAQAQHHVHFE